jgi:lipopolysaccharide transport system permease protein
MWEYLGEVWRFRYFWSSLVQIDLRARYRRSVLGLWWSLLHPLAMTIVMCTVFHKLFQMNYLEYAPYLLSGLACWNYLVTVTVNGCLCFLQGEPYIRQYPTPIAIYPLRIALGAMVHLCLTLTAAIAVTWFCQGFGNLPALIYLAPGLVLLFVLGWSVAILAGILHTVFRDMKHICDVGLQILFYATPILYSVEKLGGGRLSRLVSHNPVIPFIDLIREPVLYGQAPSLVTFASALAVAAIAALFAGLGVARLQQRLIFYL